MRLSDLQAGMRVKLRNNDLYKIIDISGSSIEMQLIEPSYENIIVYKRSYDEDLRYLQPASPNLDIMEVLTMDFHMNWKAIWKRDVGNDDAQDEWEYIRKALLEKYSKVLLEKYSIIIQKEEKGMKELYNLIDKVYFNESKRTTTIKFKNGDISKATATVGTEFCEHAGFMAALFKYQYGKVKDLETFIKRKGVRQ